MQFISAQEVDRQLDFPALIEALRQAFTGGYAAPSRHHHEVDEAGRASHLLMPAWTEGAPGKGAYLGTKVVNVFRDNAALGLPAVLGVYLLQSGETGAPLAVLDGTQLTYWRTAAASGLAASFLAAQAATRLLMIGAGALAPFLIRAHAAVRPITHVAVWNRRRSSAEALAAAFAGDRLTVTVADDLAAAVSEADVISAATLATEPLIAGAWLRAGQHVDLVGAFTMGMREADAACLRRASVFVDTADATHEGGDVAIALRNGEIQPSDVRSTLHDLCRGAPGRARPDDITLFKSAGAAIEDLAAARLVWERWQAASKLA